MSASTDTPAVPTGNVCGMNQTYAMYQKLVAKNDKAGRGLFSTAFALRAPYFRTVAPMVQTMEPHRGVVRIKKWWGVQNHIGTVHAIAVANGMEAAMGLLAEATTPDGMRWIPKGIQLDYVAKTPGDIECVAETTPEQWDKQPPFQVDVKVTGRVVKDGAVAVEGVIPIYISAKK